MCDAAIGPGIDNDRSYSYPDTERTTRSTCTLIPIVNDDRLEKYRMARVKAEGIRTEISKRTTKTSRSPRRTTRSTTTIAGRIDRITNALSATNNKLSPHLITGIIVGFLLGIGAIIVVSTLSH